MTKHLFAAALVAVVSVCLCLPASAAVIVITQAKAEAGTVTPNDNPGFPVTLSVRGAYRFDTNLIVPANKVGLQATTQYVDIDMNGFILSGLQGNSSTRIGLVGLQSSFGLSHIHNGTITGFKEEGFASSELPPVPGWSKTCRSSGTATMASTRSTVTTTVSKAWLPIAPVV